jgi:hypothetical protein
MLKFGACARAALVGDITYSPFVVIGLRHGGCMRVALETRSRLLAMLSAGRAAECLYICNRACRQYLAAARISQARSHVQLAHFMR